MKIIHLDGFPDEERSSYKVRLLALRNYLSPRALNLFRFAQNVIFGNTFNSMKTLIEAAGQLEINIKLKKNRVRPELSDFHTG